MGQLQSQVILLEKYHDHPSSSSLFQYTHEPEYYLHARDYIPYPPPKPNVYRMDSYVEMVRTTTIEVPWKFFQGIKSRSLEIVQDFYHRHSHMDEYLIFRTNKDVFPIGRYYDLIFSLSWCCDRDMFEVDESTQWKMITKFGKQRKFM